MDKQMTIMPTIETTKECGKLVEKGCLSLFEKIILRVQKKCNGLAQISNSQELIRNLQGFGDFPHGEIYKCETC